jgi:hypothetical protein
MGWAANDLAGMAAPLHDPALTASLLVMLTREALISFFISGVHLRTKNSNSMGQQW